MHIFFDASKLKYFKKTSRLNDVHNINSCEDVHAKNGRGHAANTDCKQSRLSPALAHISSTKHLYGSQR